MAESLIPSSRSFRPSQKKKPWLIFAGDACIRDTPLDGLDLPLPDDPAHPDPASYQAERRALQLTRISSSRSNAFAMSSPSNDRPSKPGKRRFSNVSPFRFAVCRNRVLN